MMPEGNEPRSCLDVWPSPLRGLRGGPGFEPPTGQCAAGCGCGLELDDLSCLHATKRKSISFLGAAHVAGGKPVMSRPEGIFGAQACQQLPVPLGAMARRIGRKMVVACGEKVKDSLATKPGFSDAASGVPQAVQVKTTDGLSGRVALAPVNAKIRVLSFDQAARFHRFF